MGEREDVMEEDATKGGGDGRTRGGTNLNVFLLESGEKILEIRVIQREVFNCCCESCVVRLQL